MNNMPQLRDLTRLCALIVACQLSTAQAAVPAPVEVKPNDTLSGIVRLAYPGYGNRQVAMQAILEKNPGAFVNNNIHRLIVGKVLQLPDVSEFPVIAPRVQIPEPADEATQTHQETLQQLENISQERNHLTSALTKLEADNQSLLSKITELEKLKSEQGEQLEQLEAQKTDLQKAASRQEEQLVTLQKNTDSTTSEKNTLQQQFDTLKAQQTTDSSQLQQTLETLRNTNATLKADNAALSKQLQDAGSGLETDEAALLEKLQNTSAHLEKLQNTSAHLETDNTALQEQLDAVREQFTASTKQVKLLETDLDKLNQQNTELTNNLEVLNTQNTNLQSALDTADQQNTVLQNDIDQIKASSANDVKLLEEQQTLQNKNPLWPWLLALLLLPIAWLLGRRSRPAPEQTNATITIKDEVPAQSLTAATNDPVIPTALPGELDDVAKLDIPVIPDAPDAAIKLDMARAYLDLRDAEAANDMLREVIREGGTQQQQEAREILSFIN